MPDLSMPAAVGWLAARDPAALAVVRPGAVDADAEALRRLAVRVDAIGIDSIYGRLPQHGG